MSQTEKSFQSEEGFRDDYGIYYTSSDNGDRQISEATYLSCYNQWLEKKLTESDQQNKELMSFEQVEQGLLKSKAKSEYMQASIILVRYIFKEHLNNKP